MDDHLGLKFSGFADRGTLDRVVVSIFWIGGLICTKVKEEATIFKVYGGAWRCVAWHLDLKFSGLVDLGPMHQFCKIFPRFAQIWMRNPRVVGNLWRRVMALLCTLFSGFCCSKSLEDFYVLIFLWNLVRSFRNLEEEMAGIVKLVAILVYIVVLTLAALTGGWLRLDLRVRREMVSHHFFCFSALNVIVYFQISVQTSLTLSAFEFAISDFELHKPLYKAIRGMHWVIQA